MDKVAVRRAIQHPVVYQILLMDNDDEEQNDLTTPLYEELAKHHNEMYFNFAKENKISLHDNKSNGELTQYDEDELRWRKPYTKLSVPEFEAYVATV